MTQRFFYKREPNPNWYPALEDMAYCFAWNAHSEHELKVAIIDWNRRFPHFLYTFVPNQCVKKLFGHTNFGGQVWPKAKGQRQ